MVSMEVVEVNPVIDEVEPHGGSGSGTDHVGHGKEDSVNENDAWPWFMADAAASTKFRMRSAKSIMAAMDAEQYEVIALLDR